MEHGRAPAQRPEQQRRGRIQREVRVHHVGLGGLAACAARQKAHSRRGIATACPATASIAAGASSAGPITTPRAPRQLLEQLAVVAVEATDRRGEPTQPEHQRAGVGVHSSKSSGRGAGAICDHPSPAGCRAPQPHAAGSPWCSTVHGTPAWQQRALEALDGLGAAGGDRGEARRRPPPRRCARRAHAALERRLFRARPGRAAPRAGRSPRRRPARQRRRS